GDAVLVPVARLSSLLHEPPGEVLTLRLSRTRFAPVLRKWDGGYMRPIAGGVEALRLLTGYVDLSWDQGIVSSPQLRQLMVSHVYDLMAVLGGTGRDAVHAAQDGGVRAARLHAIKQDIERSLDQSDLSVAALAAQHRCSPRFVQRLFEADGTTFTE